MHKNHSLLFLKKYNTYNTNNNIDPPNINPSDTPPPLHDTLLCILDLYFCVGYYCLFG